MPWKDSQSEKIVDEQEQLQRRSASTRGFGLGVIGYAILGVGILVLSGVILYLFLGQSMNEDSEQIRVMAERLSAIENRITALETTSRGDDALAQRSKRMELFIGRFEKLEATTARRLSDLDGRIASLESGSRRTPSPKPATIASPLPSAKASTAAETVHVVSKGDTLYSISRKYGLSVDDLLKQNGLQKGAVIHPGQSLKVTAASQ